MACTLGCSLTDPKTYNQINYGRNHIKTKVFTCDDVKVENDARTSSAVIDKMVTEGDGVEILAEESMLNVEVDCDGAATVSAIYQIFVNSKGVISSLEALTNSCGLVAVHEMRAGVRLAQGVEVSRESPNGFTGSVLRPTIATVSPKGWEKMKLPFIATLTISGKNKKLPPVIKQIQSWL